MINKEKHLTFWQINNIEPDKRYYILFSTWKDMLTSMSITGYDILDDAFEEIKLLKEVYNNTPKPQKIYKKDYKYAIFRDKHNYFSLDFSDGAYFWGYALLDLKECKFIKIGNNGFYNYKKSITSKMNKKDLEYFDYYFRKNNEIPEDYEWHHNEDEYKGWLQFRWGDGKNAIDYVEPPKKERPGVTEVHEIYDNATDSFIKRKVRVVYVDWDEPLPKKEKGIIYLRPNKEPVKFPGDFGYEGDFNVYPWSLEEEIAYSEYDNEQNKTTISDILGDNNILLKLKNK